ncbi:hypothetical protein ACTXT7_001916 [Hymenolepis weldensis]
MAQLALILGILFGLIMWTRSKHFRRRQYACCHNSDMCKTAGSKHITADSMTYIAIFNPGKVSEYGERQNSPPRSGEREFEGKIRWTNQALTDILEEEVQNHCY